MGKRGLLPDGAATLGSSPHALLFFFFPGPTANTNSSFSGPYDSDSTSSDEAAAPTPEMADRAEKMRRRLSQRASGAAAASSSQSSPAPRSTPPPPRTVVDLMPSPVVSPSRAPPPPPSESPSSKRPVEQSDAPAPKRIRLSIEPDEDAQIWQGSSFVRSWADHVLLPKDVEMTGAMPDEYILEASLRQSYRNLTFQMEMSRRLRGYKMGLQSLSTRLRQTEEARLEEQAKHAKSVESAAIEADVKAAVAAGQKEIAQEWLATPEGDDYLLDLGERGYRLGFREAQMETYAALLARDSAFTPESWGLKPVLDLLPATADPASTVDPASLPAADSADPAALPAAEPTELAEPPPQAEDSSLVLPAGPSAEARAEEVDVDTPSPVV
ncbi:PREDICTED: flocculation protein FLO11-like [Ipomoea nil]|uniref:flocculation protein FLO11-like n=1 Tax=Ipomoea nil TaxID=35883 RepID=UPI000900A252|nr:PREDICTED: flocculation protein FLO11-like [Ipomoea nil]